MKAHAKHTDSNASMPGSVKPMLATLVKQVFSDEDYVFEVKWDGYRIIAHCQNNIVHLYSRGGEDYTRKYPAVARAVKELNRDCIIDGEVVYINDEGKPDMSTCHRFKRKYGHKLQKAKK